MKDDQIVQLAGDPLNPDNAKAAARVFADSALWPEFEKALYPEAKIAEEDANTIRRFVEANCRRPTRGIHESLRDFCRRRLTRLSSDVGDFALAAASKARTSPSPSSENADVGEPEGPITFVFVSEVASDGMDRNLAWRAELTLLPDAGLDTMLSISLVDGEGEPVAGGMFRVAGATLPVARGHAEIPYGLFLTGIKDAVVERITAEGVHLPGTLALF